jgi:hypothetical protein
MLPSETKNTCLIVLIKVCLYSAGQGGSLITFRFSRYSFHICTNAHGIVQNIFEHTHTHVHINMTHAMYIESQITAIEPLSQKQKALVKRRSWVSLSLPSHLPSLPLLTLLPALSVPRPEVKGWFVGVCGQGHQAAQADSQLATTASNVQRARAWIYARLKGCMRNLLQLGDACKEALSLQQPGPQHPPAAQLEAGAVRKEGRDGGGKEALVLCAAHQTSTQEVLSSENEAEEHQTTFVIKTVAEGINSGRNAVLRADQERDMLLWIQVHTPHAPHKSRTCITTHACTLSSSFSFFLSHCLTASPVQAIEVARQEALRKENTSKNAFQRARERARLIYSSDEMEYAVSLVILGSFFSSIIHSQVSPPPPPPSPVCISPSCL